MEVGEGPSSVPEEAPVKLEEKTEDPIALTPPQSGHEMDDKDGSSSELSEPPPIEEDDIGPIEPDHYWDDGKIPVFKPTMAQFKDFEKFVLKIDEYGMKSGIVKIVPPQEWRDSLPALDEAIKTVRIKNPIRQEFAGAHGCYVQANIEKQRSYNLPQWKALTEQSNHQPPERRGERRRAAEAHARAARTRSEKPPLPSDGPPRKRGRPPKRKPASSSQNVAPAEEKVLETTETPAAPPTPASPGSDDRQNSDEKEAADEAAKSISARRQNAGRTEVEEVDEAAFKDFDYRMKGLEGFTPERCKELEQVYWKTVPSALPMYGADMAGSLFDERTEHWNVAKLPNLLDVLGTKVPGVNSTYCYFGMWKATFAWHLEDVDLYSINYIHFGAPKQWYSISQSDLKRFEMAMRNKWPNDYKNCNQFIRHKTYLMSPSLLESQFNIKVNKLVHYEGEFVITYPYGYHSGFNLGYNCAESVNFATESWLEYAKKSARCECEADSVWVDPYEIERKLRGEPTPEYYETEIEIDSDDDDEMHNLPSPDSTAAGKAKIATSRKRKREIGASKDGHVKRVKIIKKKAGPCVLCPNDVSYDSLLLTNTAKKAHRLCANYTPETAVISGPKGGEKVIGIEDIDKARLGLKCNHCHTKFGACFQCSAKKCTRAYHATCAAEAGVLVDQGPVPVFDEDGTEYYFDGFDFRCRWHRPKRAKDPNISDTLETKKHIREFAQALQPGQVVQAQYSHGGAHGDIFCGVVLENRPSERSVMLDALPDHVHVEVEWKWLLTLDPSESQRPKPSENAVPLPDHLRNEDLNTKHKDGPPEVDDPFSDPNLPEKWAEFNTTGSVKLPPLVKVDLDKAHHLWHYLGRTSTEAKAQYTDDLTRSIHNPKSNFLDTVKPPPPPPRKPTYPDLRRISNHGLQIHVPQKGNAGQMFHARQYQAAQQSFTPPTQFPSASYASSVNSRAGWVDPRLSSANQHAYGSNTMPSSPYGNYPQPDWQTYRGSNGHTHYMASQNQGRKPSFGSKGDPSSHGSQGHQSPPTASHHHSPSAQTQNTPTHGSRPASSAYPGWSSSPTGHTTPVGKPENQSSTAKPNYTGSYYPTQQANGHTHHSPSGYYWPPYQSPSYGHGHGHGHYNGYGSYYGHGSHPAPTPQHVSNWQNSPVTAGAKPSTTIWKAPYTGPPKKSAPENKHSASQSGPTTKSDPTAQKSWQAPLSGAFNTTGSDGDSIPRTPVRPVYSPLSDAGKCASPGPATAG